MDFEIDQIWVGDDLVSYTCEEEYCGTIPNVCLLYRGKLCETKLESYAERWNGI